MVRIKEQTHILDDGSIDLNAWLEHLALKPHYVDNHQIHNACLLSQLTGQDQATESGFSCLQQGLAIAEILADLDVSQEALAAAILYDSVQFAELDIEDIREQLGDKTAKLVEGVERMGSIDMVRKLGVSHHRSQMDNVRKMLLAMVDDVQVVLIKLAERLYVLRSAKRMPESFKQHIASEVMQIYAPLANRLGVGQIKWEMEDLAFRYLQPEKYKEIASGLSGKRLERERFVDETTTTLRDKVKQLGISESQVDGRAKHIHSIDKKMQRKNVDLSQIYDAIAVRVLVPTIEDCYKVLSVVHAEWDRIPEEFDDYIADPKPNGYRSLHTAVTSPEGRVFEVQIRTFQMHEEAELGVAAHWRYKEGVTGSMASHEQKIQWLRDVLAWQKEVTRHGADALEDHTTQFLEARIYVFTPNGDVIDLQRNSTPLDFAYSIHSEVGNRCRGAKVNDHIVPLTHTLNTGDKIEILTAKNGKPSRDWLNPHLGYVTSSRAKAKIMQWFKQQHYDKNVETGQAMFDREVRKLNVKEFKLDKIAKQLNYKKPNDMLAALGRGDLRHTQILAKLLQHTKPLTPVKHKPVKTTRVRDDQIMVHGVGNLLTQTAKCCNPLPGDDIIGYITITRGVTIHRKDCPNILHSQEKQQKRLLSVSWGSKQTEAMRIDLMIQAYDRSGLLHDISSVLKQDHTDILALTVETDRDENTCYISVAIQLDDINHLSRVLDRLQQLSNVIDVKRGNS